MHEPTFGLLIEFFKAFGFAGIVFIVWIVDSRNIRRILAHYREDMRDMRSMYESNVILVRQYEALAKDLKDVVTLNTQVNTELVQAVRTNQFCPIVRKEQHG